MVYRPFLFLVFESPHLTYPLRAGWPIRLQWILSSLPCFWLSVWLGSKTLILKFSFFLYCTPPCCSWAAHFPSAFWYPRHCCLAVTVVLHSEYKANPSTSSYFYFCADSFNFCPTEYVIVRHDVRQIVFESGFNFSSSAVAERLHTGRFVVAIMPFDFKPINLGNIWITM